MPDPSRVLRGTIGAHRSWAHTSDRSARTAPARAGLLARFEREADPDGTLTPEERARRAEHLRQAFYAEMSLKALHARRKKARTAPDSP